RMTQGFRELGDDETQIGIAFTEVVQSGAQVPHAVYGVAAAKGEHPLASLAKSRIERKIVISRRIQQHLDITRRGSKIPDPQRDQTGGECAMKRGCIVDRSSLLDALRSGAHRPIRESL